MISKESYEFKKRYYENIIDKLKAEIKTILDSNQEQQKVIAIESKRGYNKALDEFEKELDYELDKPSKCLKCGWKGRESGLGMDEAMEFHCPKCREEVNFIGVDPNVAAFILKLKKKFQKLKVKHESVN